MKRPVMDTRTTWILDASERFYNIPEKHIKTHTPNVFLRLCFILNGLATFDNAKKSRLATTWQIPDYLSKRRNTSSVMFQQINSLID